MKIKALRTFRNDIGMVRRNAEVDIPDTQAKSLIKRGLAVAVEDKAEKAPKPEKPHVPAKAKPEKAPAKGAAATKGE